MFVGSAAIGPATTSNPSTAASARRPPIRWNRVVPLPNIVFPFPLESNDARATPSPSVKSSAWYCV